MTSTLTAAFLVATAWRTVAVTGDRVDGISAGPNGTVSVGGEGKVCIASDDPPHAFCDRGQGLEPVLRANRTLPVEPVYAVPKIGDGIAYDDAVAIDEDGEYAFIVNGEMLVTVIDDRVHVLSGAGGNVALIGVPRIAHGRVAFMTSDGMNIAVYRASAEGIELIDMTNTTMAQQSAGIIVDVDLGASLGDRVHASVDATEQVVLRENQVLASFGDPVPRTDGGTFERFILTAVDEDSGDVAFTARVGGGSSSGQIGLFVATEGRIETLALPGDRVTVRDGDERTVDEVIFLSEAPNRGSQTFTKGELGFALAFTDGTMGAFVADARSGFTQ